jgi:hypothetical protein
LSRGWSNGGSRGGVATRAGGGALAGADVGAAGGADVALAESAEARGAGAEGARGAGARGAGARGAGRVEQELKMESSYPQDEEGEELYRDYEQAVPWDLDTLDFNFASGQMKVRLKGQCQSMVLNK